RVRVGARARVGAVVLLGPRGARPRFDAPLRRVAAAVVGADAERARVLLHRIRARERREREEGERPTFHRGPSFRRLKMSKPRPAQSGELVPSRELVRPSGSRSSVPAKTSSPNGSVSVRPGRPAAFPATEATWRCTGPIGFCGAVQEKVHVVTFGFVPAATMVPLEP